MGDVPFLFQKLFKDANKISGADRDPSVHQADTSVFDQPYSTGGDNSEAGRDPRVKVSDREIERLRSITRRITLNVPENRHSILGTYSAKEKTELQAQRAKVSDTVLNIGPGTEWEREVSQVMMNHDTDEDQSEHESDNDKFLPSDQKRKMSSSVRPAAASTGTLGTRESSAVTHRMLPQERISFDVAPFHCFDPDFVDIDCTQDPLDVLIPNGKSVRSYSTMIMHADTDADAGDTSGVLRQKDEQDRYSVVFGAQMSSKVGNGQSRFVLSEPLATFDGSGPRSLPTTGPPVFTSPAADTSVTHSLAAVASGVGSGAVMTGGTFDGGGELSRNAYLEKERQRKLEKAQRIRGIDIGLNAEASILESAARRTTDILPQNRSRGNRSLIAALNHSPVSTSHLHAKPDLYEVELKYFHRPRMIRERDRPWTISLKTVSKKQTLNAVTRVAKAETEKRNLSLANNSANFILLEYIEEFPPVMLNYGMASAIFNYYRAPRQNEEEEQEEEEEREAEAGAEAGAEGGGRRNIADKQRQRSREEADRVIQSVLDSATRCRLPRHVLLLLQRRNQKLAYDHDVTVPRLKEGETKVLSDDDESPFLGRLAEGEIQQSFNNNLFRAPIFKHSAHPTDFLLIRTKLSAQSMHYAMREIPQVFLAGQIEPQRTVPRPVAGITQLQERFYLLATARYLQAKPDGADFSDLQRSLLKYCLKESVAPHKVQHRTLLRKVIKQVAEEIKDPVAGVKWYTKDFQSKAGTLSEMEIRDMEQRISPEELAKAFTPEDVCLQESTNAAEYRLFQQHVTDVELPKVEAWLSHMHRVKQAQMSRAEKLNRLVTELQKRIARVSSSGSSRSSNSRSSVGEVTSIVLTSNDVPAVQNLITSLESTVKVLVQRIRRLDVNLSIGRLVFDRLVGAPWNTSAAFVRSYLERDGLGRMELRGIGDPSGRGEGFAFVRIVRLPSLLTLGAAGAGGDGDPSGGIPGSTAALQRKRQLWDTDSDLRKLTKEDAVRLLVAAGVREQEARALRRWDRIHMIREMSTKLEKSGLAKDLHKYARSSTVAGGGGAAGEDGTPMLTAEEFRTIAQDIWNRQRAALSSTVPPPTSKAHTHAHASAGNGNASTGGAGDHDGNGNSNDNGNGNNSDSDSDSDFAQDIERSLAARAAAAASVEQRERARLEAKRHREEEEQRELQAMRSLLAGAGSGAGSGAGAGSGNNAASTVLQKKRRVQIGIDGLSGPATAGAVTLPAFQPSSSASPSSSSASSAAIGSTEQPGRTGPADLAPDWVRPQRVVKRITQVITADGSESVRIEFLFANSEVERTERACARQKKAREQRRAASAVGESFTGTTASSRSGDSGGVGDGDGDGGGSSAAASGKLNIQLSKLKKKVDESHQQQRAERAEAEAQRNADLYAPRHGGGTTKSSKRNVAALLSNRVPRVTFAVRLEKALMELWNSKHAHIFHHPVDFQVAQNYYSMISKPICLSQIREKIVSYEYETAQAMLEDVALMVHNAETYNGREHIIAERARKLLKRLEDNLGHDRKHLGEDKDPIRKMEEAIQRKKVYLQKTLGSG